MENQQPQPEQEIYSLIDKDEDSYEQSVFAEGTFEEIMEVIGACLKEQGEFGGFHFMTKKEAIAIFEPEQKP